MSLEAAQLGVIKAGFDAACREMAVNLRRSAISSIVREAKDFSVAIADRTGLVFAQADCIPILTSGISIALANIADRVDLDALDEDSVIITNDPFDGAQHLQDIFVFTPIFFEGELFGFGACAAHHVDLGGMHAGISAGATEIYQEGVRIPLSVFSRPRDLDSPTGFVRNLLAGNVRVPDAVIGDLHAQLAANATAEVRTLEMLEHFGADVLHEAIDLLIDYAETRMRAAIRALPDGVYEASDSFEGAAWGIERIEIRSRVEIAGDEITITFDGTSAQVEGNINCPVASTVSAAISAVRCMLPDRDVPFNEGSDRPIHVTVPEGTILNPRFPAALRARMTPASRVFSSVVRALCEAHPGSAVASGYDCTTAFSISRLQSSGNYAVSLEMIGAGWGACGAHDGVDALDNPLSNCANAPVESLETDFDFFTITEYSLRDESAGHGRTAGGRGVRRTYRATKDGVKVAGYSDRHATGAPGYAGGGIGGRGRHAILRSDGTIDELATSFEAVLNTGDAISIETGGGGGYGEP